MQIISRSPVKSTSAFLLIGFLALMAIVGMDIWLGERAQTYFDDAVSARDTRVAAVELRSALQTADASVRGFLLAGNEIYLAPYNTAKHQAQRHLTALQLLLKAYPNSDAILDRLETILTSKFDEFDRTIELKRNQQDDKALAIFRTNNGKALTDEANVFFSGIITKADSRLTAGVAEQRLNGQWLRLVSAAGALIIILVVGGAAYGLTRYTKELRTTRDEVSALNCQLEDRVARRTADLAQARDRAEVLLSEVNHRVANSLALVSSLVSLQSKALTDQGAKDALVETQDRIFAISLVHKRLYSSENVGTVDLREYVGGLLDHVRSSMGSRGNRISLGFDIEPIELETDASINLGVVLTEMVTNAFKYAYPEGEGEVRVLLRKLDGRIEMRVEDDGVGRAEGMPAKGTGVGTRIINAMCKSLGAEVEYLSGKPGTTTRLTFTPTVKPRDKAPSSVR